ncbi:unnamed protein product, partial [Mesorhabditis belari]|uniref:Chromosome partition protein Smc n=1 Tax=Mesorhabditis belari TaxID=2138241 RepID=A0AAF3FM72_9BILA
MSSRIVPTKFLFFGLFLTFLSWPTGVEGNGVVEQTAQKVEQIKATYRPQRHKMVTVTESFQKVQSNLLAMRKSDDFEAKIFTEIQTVINSLKSEKEKQETLLRSFGDQRLALVNEKENFIRSRQHFENEIAQLGNRLGGVQGSMNDLTNRKRELEAEMASLNAERERLDRRRSKWYRKWLLRGQYKAMKAKSRMAQARIGQLQGEIDQINALNHETNEKRHQVNLHNEYIAKMEASIRIVESVYNQLNSWSGNLGDWVLYLDTLIPRAIRVQDNLEFGDEEEEGKRSPYTASPRERSYKLLPKDVLFCSYMIDTCGEDYEEAGQSVENILQEEAAAQA